MRNIRSNIASIRSAQKYKILNEENTTAIYYITSTTTACVSSRYEDEVLTLVSAKRTGETLKTSLLKEMKETYIEMFD